MWFFVHKFFQYLARFKVFNSKSDTLYRFYLKTWHVKSFCSKCDASTFFYFKIWQFVIVWIRNLMHWIDFNSKCNASFTEKLKTIHELKIWNQNLSGYKLFNSRLFFNAFFSLLAWDSLLKKNDARLVKFLFLFQSVESFCMMVPSLWRYSRWLWWLFLLCY